MDRMKASDFPQEVLNLFDKYIHGDIDRRSFLEGAQKFTVGSLTAMGILEALRPNYAWAQQVPKDDKRIKIETVTVPSPQGNTEIKGSLVRPSNASGKLPGVLVVHENRGLNPYIEDVARRLGTALKQLHLGELVASRPRRREERLSHLRLELPELQMIAQPRRGVHLSVLLPLCWLKGMRPRPKT